MILKLPVKSKKKQCIICGSDKYPIWSKKRCKLCTMKQDAENKKSTSTFSKPKPKPKNKALDTFFEKHIKILSKFKVSEESGDSIPHPTKLNISHLFPKRNHKSVEAHEMNCIYLTWDEHTKLDNQYLDRLDFKGLEQAFPNSYQLIIERMRIVRATITEKTNMVEAFDKFNGTLDF